MKSYPPAFAASKKAASLPASTNLLTPNLQVLAVMPRELLGSFGSSDGRLALIDAIPRETTTPKAGMDLVQFQLEAKARY